MCPYVKFSYCFSLKHIYKGQICLKKCLKLCKSVQKCPKLFKKSKYLKSKLYSLYNLTLNIMDTYVSKCKNGFCFSLKFIYKGQICLKKCLKLCKSVQKCPNISNQNYTRFII